MTLKQKFKLDELLTQFGNANFDCGDFQMLEGNVHEYEKRKDRVSLSKKTIMEYLEKLIP